MEELSGLEKVAGSIGPKPEQSGTITIDQPSRTIIVQQMANQFSLKPDTVKLPFDTLKLLAAQVTLLDAGVMQVVPAGGASQLPG